MRHAIAAGGLWEIRAIGERRIKPTVGFEPTTTGLQNQSTENTSLDDTITCESAKAPLTPQLTPKSRKQGETDTGKQGEDLAEIVAAWPELLKPIRSVILTLIRASIDKQES